MKIHLICLFFFVNFTAFYDDTRALVKILMYIGKTLFAFFFLSPH